MSGFERRLTAVAGAVEKALDAILLDAHPAGEGWPSRLREAMRYAALGGGKRLRPFLLVETARLFGREDGGPVIAACALELIHCYSLVHDDLPAMDDDDLRRGKPTVHKAFDEATAILAGDALLTLAFEVMADARVDRAAGVRLALVADLARAAGPAGMAGGQALDLEAEGRIDRRPLTERDIRRLQAMKTGALLKFAVVAGARLGRAAPDASARLAGFGEALGAAFQIGDDIFDVESTPAALGKATNKDAAKGKATLVEALGLKRAKAERDALADRAIAALSGFGGAADVLRAAARFTVERRS